MKFGIKKKVIGFSGLSMLALLSACADSGAPQPDEPSVYDGAIRSEVAQELADSASRSTNALESLAMIRKSKSPAVSAPVDETSLSPDLQRTVTTSWSGPANDLVKQLATNLGYTYLETGGTSKDPVMVNVDVHDVAIGKVLEDIGLQSSPSATIIVNPNIKRIEFRNTLGYRGPSVGGGSPSHPIHRVLKKKGHPPVRHASVDGGSVHGPEHGPMGHGPMGMPPGMVPVN